MATTAIVFGSCTRKKKLLTMPPPACVFSHAERRRRTLALSFLRGSQHGSGLLHPQNRWVTIDLLCPYSTSIKGGMFPVRAPLHRPYAVSRPASLAPVLGDSKQ